MVRKATLVIKIKFYAVIVTDMFHKYRTRGLKEFCKNDVLDSFAISTRKPRSLLLKKVAGYWLIKKRLWHSCFPVDCIKCFKNTFFEGSPQVAVNDDSE